MSDNILRNKDRGRPGNPGGFTNQDRTEGDVTLGNPPTVLEHDGGEIVITKIGDELYRVSGLGDEHSGEFNGPPSVNIERMARVVYDNQVLAYLRQSFENVGGRGVELADQIDFYEQRLGISSSAFAHISPGDSEYFSGSELDDNVIDFIEVQVTDPEDGEQPEIYAEAGVTLNFEDWARERGVLDTDEWLNANQNEIDAWVRANYGDMRLEGGGDSWESQNLTALVEFDDQADVPRTLPDMEAAVVEQTKLVDLHNDLNGAYGTGHLYGFWARLGIHIDAVEDGSVEPLSKH